MIDGRVTRTLDRPDRWLPGLGHDPADRDVHDADERCELLRAPRRVSGLGPRRGRREHDDGPTATVSAGTFHYYNGLLLEQERDRLDLDTLTVTCSKTQLVGLSTVTWRVTVASGRLARDHDDERDGRPGRLGHPLGRPGGDAPIEIRVRYEFIVDGVTEVNRRRDVRPRSARAQHLRAAAVGWGGVGDGQGPPAPAAARGERGLTLVELVVAMGILSIVPR